MLQIRRTHVTKRSLGTAKESTKEGEKKGSGLHRCPSGGLPDLWARPQRQNVALCGMQTRRDALFWYSGI